jgi:spore germination cell wall hydrolase CwlJ-like protein
MPLEIAYQPVVLPPAPAVPCAGAPAPGDSAVPVPTMRAEPRPRDFVARIRRRDMVSLRRLLHRPARVRQRIAGITLIGVLPALLAAIGWGDPRGIGGAVAQDAGAVAQDAGAVAQDRVAPWHAATPTDGLLSPAAATAAWDRTLATVHSDADPGTLPTMQSGPAARPISSSGSGLDRARALQCMTAAIYYEAAREPDEGQRAVAQVVLNRVAHPAFPKSVCGVVYQGSERSGCQFSFACDGSLARAPMAAYWDRARRVAETALAGYVYAPVGLATHYHTSAVHPGWADTMSFLGTIGAHRFYRWTGSAGQPRAFNAVYAGGEPMAAPHPRTWVSTGADFADPMVLEKAFEAGRLTALRAVVASPVAADPAIVRAGASFGQQPLPQATPPAAERPARILPGSGTVRPDAEQQYDNAAHWIRQPGA